MNIIKTEYPASEKVVLEHECTGIMISMDHYQDMVHVGMSDEQIFDVLRWN